MPKKIKRVNKFDKGLINNPDKRDIPDGGLANATNVMVDIPGQIRQMGNEVSSHVLGFDNQNLSGNLTAGYGAHVLKSDHNMVNANTQNAKMVIVQQDKDFNIVENGQEYTNGGDGEIDTGWTGSNVTPAFFDFNGTLRVSQSIFSDNDHENYSFTHINKVFFGDAGDGSKPIYAHGTAVDGYGGATTGDWMDVPQRIKRPSASVLTINDVITAGTPPTAVGKVYVDIEYDTATNVGDEGEWPGDTAHKFGVSFLYDGVGEIYQESLIHISSTTVDTSSVWGLNNGILGIKMGFVANTAIAIGSTSYSYDPRIVGAVLYWCGDSTGDFDDPMVVAKANFLKSTVTTHDGEETTMDFEQSSGTVYRYGNNIVTNGDAHLYSSRIPTITYEAQTHIPNSVESNYARFKCAVISNRRLYAANIQRYKESNTGTITAMPAESDRMLISPAHNFDILPSSDYLDVATQDGDAITALAAIGDKILQFKSKTLYIINTSQDYEYVEAEHKFLGVGAPYSIISTEFGIVWVNTNGCYIYNGQEIKNLIDQRISLIRETAPVIIDGTEVNMEMPGWSQFITGSQSGQVGYITLTKQLVVFDSPYGVDDFSGDIMIYDFRTKSWTYGKDRVGRASRSNVITGYIDELVYLTFGDHSAGDSILQLITDGNDGLSGSDQIWKISGLDANLVNTSPNTEIIVELTNDTAISDSVNITADELDIESGNTLSNKIASAIRSKLGEHGSVDTSNGFKITYSRLASDINTYAGFNIRFDQDSGELPIYSDSSTKAKHYENTESRQVFPVSKFISGGSPLAYGHDIGSLLQMGLYVNQRYSDSNKINPAVISEMAIQYPNSSFYSGDNYGRLPLYMHSVMPSWADSSNSDAYLPANITYQHSHWHDEEYFTTIDGFSIPYDPYGNTSGSYNKPETTHHSTGKISMYMMHPDGEKRFCNPGAVWIKSWLATGQSDIGETLYNHNTGLEESLPSSKPTYPNAWYKVPLRNSYIGGNGENGSFTGNNCKMQNMSPGYVIAQQEMKIDAHNLSSEPDPWVMPLSFSRWFKATESDIAYIIGGNSSSTRRTELFTEMHKWASNVYYDDNEAVQVNIYSPTLGIQTYESVPRRVYGWDNNAETSYKRIGDWYESSQNEEEINNGTFLNVVSPWIPGDGVSPPEFTILAIVGGGFQQDCLQIQTNGATEGYFSGTSQTVNNLTQTTYYQLSFRHKNIDNLSFGNLRYKIYDRSNDVIILDWQSVNPDSTQWVKESTVFRTPLSCTSIILYFQHHRTEWATGEANWSTYIDEVSIKESTIAAGHSWGVDVNTIGIEGILASKINDLSAQSSERSRDSDEPTINTMRWQDILVDGAQTDMRSHGEIELSCNAINILPCGASNPSGDESLPYVKGDLLIMIAGDYGEDFTVNGSYQFQFGGASGKFNNLELEYDFPSTAILSNLKVVKYEEGATVDNFEISSVTYLLFKHTDQVAIMQTFFYELAILHTGIGAVGIWLQHDELENWLNLNSDVQFHNEATGSPAKPRIIYGRFIRKLTDHNAYYGVNIQHPDYATDTFNYTAQWTGGAYKSALDVTTDIKSQIITGLTNQTIEAAQYLPAYNHANAPRLWTATGMTWSNGVDTIYMRVGSLGGGSVDPYHSDGADLTSELLPGDTFKISSAPSSSFEYIVHSVQFAASAFGYVNTIVIKITGTGMPNGNLKTSVQPFENSTGTITSSTLVIQEDNPDNNSGVILSGNVSTDLIVKGFKNDPIFIKTKDAIEGTILVETPDYILNQESSLANINKIYTSFKDESFNKNGKLTIQYCTNNQEDWKGMWLRPHPNSKAIPATKIDAGVIWTNNEIYLKENFSSLKGVKSIRFRIIATNFQSFKLNDINILFRDKHIS